MTIDILVRKIDSLADRCNVCGHYKVICRFTSISIGFSFKFLQRCLNANNLNAPVVWFSLFLISINIVDNYRPPNWKLIFFFFFFSFFFIVCTKLRKTTRNVNVFGNTRQILLDFITNRVIELFEMLILINSNNW